MKLRRPFALTGIAVLAFACATLPGTATRDVGALHRTYAPAGDEGPVVVFESGLGDGKQGWRDVFTPVSTFARAFAYDRAGYGGSRSDAHPRDAETVVAELRALLRDLEIDPPYVLVGHSLGGHFVESFARAHPDEVRGVVFVDARHVDFSDRCVPEGVERCALPWWTRWLLPSGARAELDAASRTESQIRAAGPFPDVPLRVLTATQRPASMPNLRRVWAETQAELATLSKQGVQEICDTCGHYVQSDAPERVVAAVRAIVSVRPVVPKEAR